ncbi:hypothetical protein SDC9_52081 [bioreactor metagenome]|uniref:Uncharacterized protein n=1 Tax=bioreactor metagenome TaxID=1076179 RepID=A0A644WPG1_9ZZZZ
MVDITQGSVRNTQITFQREEIVSPGAVENKLHREDERLLPSGFHVHGQTDFHTVERRLADMMQIGDFRERKHRALPGINSGSLRNRSFRKRNLAERKLHSGQRGVRVAEPAGGIPYGFAQLPAGYAHTHRLRTGDEPEYLGTLDIQSSPPVIRKNQIGQLDVGDPPVSDAADHRNHLFPIAEIPYTNPFLRPRRRDEKKRRSDKGTQHLSRYASLKTFHLALLLRR